MKKTVIFEGSKQYVNYFIMKLDDMWCGEFENDITITVDGKKLKTVEERDVL